MRPWPLPTVAAIAILSGCSGSNDEPDIVPARPVTCLVLRGGTPPPSLLFPGIVSPYREVALSFEVAGRVVQLANIGDDLEGDHVDRQGNVSRPGTIVAELDRAPFARAVTQVERRLESARAQLSAQRVQLEQVLPARLDSARASAEAAKLNVSFAQDDITSAESAVELAKTTLERNEELLPSGAVSDIVVRESKASLNTAQARLAQNRTMVSSRRKEEEAAISAVAESSGLITQQEANVTSQVAVIEELEQQLLNVQSDLENCVLRAPFGGRITAAQVAEGSVVQAGSPVITLTMMTPIEVQLTVSSAIEDELLQGTDALIYPMQGNTIDYDRSVRATLFEKRGVANEGTRTFTIGLLAPNKRRALRPELANEPETPYLLPVFQNPLDVPGEDALYTVDDAVGGSLDDAYVLRVNGVSQGERSSESLRGKLSAAKVPVEIGSDLLRIASFDLVKLVGATSLSDGDLLVAFPTPRHEQSFVVSDNRWLLRPGDLVQVSMGLESRQPGFYVPVQAIREVNGENAVFMVDEGSRARRVPVTTHESTGELRRVEAPELSDGSTLVVEGAHFLTDGDLVNVIASKDGDDQ